MNASVPLFADPIQGPYLAVFAVVFLSRAADFLSTWLATPNLVLEANPIARALGWRKAIIVNLAVALVLPLFPFSAIMVATLSFLVAARNLQNAWLMRVLGEHEYYDWMSDRLRETPATLYFVCLISQSLILIAIGVVISATTSYMSIAQAMGMGIATYGVAISVFTLPTAWRIHKHGRPKSKAPQNESDSE